MLRHYVYRSNNNRNLGNNSWSTCIGEPPPPLSTLSMPSLAGPPPRRVVMIFKPESNCYTAELLIAIYSETLKLTNWYNISPWRWRKTGIQIVRFGWANIGGIIEEHCHQCAQHICPRESSILYLVRLDVFVNVVQCHLFNGIRFFGKFPIVLIGADRRRCIFTGPVQRLLLRRLRWSVLGGYLIGRYLQNCYIHTPRLF